MLSSKPSLTFPPKAMDVTEIGRWVLPIPVADHIDFSGSDSTRYIKSFIVPGIPPGTPIIKPNWKGASINSSLISFFALAIIPTSKISISGFIPRFFISCANDLIRVGGL
ncbi:hypothetical protein ES703_53740 [subsurface metagenome]